MRTRLLHVCVYVWCPAQALQQWSSLQQHWCQHSPLSVLQQLEAAEAGAWLLQRLVTQQAQQQMLCEGDVQELQQQSEVRRGRDRSLLAHRFVFVCVCVYLL